MIKKIEIKNFKRFKNREVLLNPHGLSLVVGANNSGKSSLLHAFSLWSFCCRLLLFEVGKDALLKNTKRDGFGISIDDFLPLNIPSFKYLWPNQNVQGSYSMTLTCYWDDENGSEKHLGFSLSLATERLYIRKTDSNISAGDHIPQIVYVPTFAGIDTKEEYHSPAIRAKLLGKGLSGSVIRNEILELFEENIAKRKKLKEGKSKITSKDLKNLRQNDPFEILQRELFEVYQLQLEPQKFDLAFNSYININTRKYKEENNRLIPIKEYKPRDLMVEGSGFLQWLSVYVYALSPRTDVLLLDEPDSHLHNSLQLDLFKRLENIAEKFGKLIAIATHSSEVIKIWNPRQILHVKDNSIKYLDNHSDKVKVIQNLGSEYCPKLDNLKLHKNVLFVENETDAEILKIFAQIAGIKWPENLCIWQFTSEHKERTQIFKALKSDIPELKAISLHDRDTLAKSNVTLSLREFRYKDIEDGKSRLFYRTWQRHEIENYLFCPEAIARTVVVKRGGKFMDILEEVKTYLRDTEGLVFADNEYRKKKRESRYDLFFDKDGHQVIDNIERKFKIKYVDIAKNFKREEVFDDIITFLNELVAICS